MKFPVIKRISPLQIAVLVIIVIGVGFCCFFFIGPYTGKVVDSDTGEAIEDASVLFYWTKCTPTPAGNISDLIALRLVYTDKKGNYRIPFVIALRGIFGFFESTQVVVYEPGYQAYIVTIWGNGSSSNVVPPFTKLGNVVKLKRIPSNFDHKKHYDEIEQALWGIYKQVNAETNKEEFLERAEWEERWGLAESEKEEFSWRIAMEEKQRLREEKK
jgi:hypothetical protein